MIPPEDFENLMLTLSKNDDSQMMVPVTGIPPNDHYMSRFLAKMGLEALAKVLLGTEGWNEYLVDYEGFDPIRKFSRFPNKDEVWEFSKRRIYEEDSSQLYKDVVGYQVLHEWDILAPGTPDASEFFFVIAIFGMEYAINLGGSSIDGYQLWLKSNNNCSPLYLKRPTNSHI